MANPVGAPTKSTPELKALIVKRLRKGMTRVQAAASVGIRRETLWDWAKKDDEFANAIAKALALFGRELVDAMVEISRDKESPKRLDAVKYLLESRFPDESPRIKKHVLEAMEEHDHRIVAKLQELDPVTRQKVSDALAEARQDAMAGRPSPAVPDEQRSPAGTH